MSESAKLLNYTTKVPAVRTVAQMQEELAKHGATSIKTDYADGKPVALTFQIEGPHGPHMFRMPADVPAVQKVLDRLWSQRRIPRSLANPAQAERVAWRVCYTWLTAQLALVQAGMATIEHAMLPQMVVDLDGTTLYERFAEHGARALGS